ncbi:hypothetical protein [Persephonella sp.]
MISQIFLQKKILTVLVLLMFSLIVSCGSSSDALSESSPNSGNYTPVSPVYGTAQLGNLADAGVEIYEIQQDGNLKLLWTETTSSGDVLEKIGKFNTHANEMEDDRFYLIKVSGGQDWDSNDDGIIDDEPAENKGAIRLVAKGSDIKQAGENLRVTAVSEILYQKVKKYIYYNFNPQTLEEEINRAVSTTLSGDNPSLYDLITFDPVVDRGRLKDVYKIKYFEITASIKEGSYIAHLIGPQIISSVDTPGYANSVALSQDGTKAFVADGSSGLQIIDISDISNPQIISSVDTPDTANSVALSQDGTKAFVADGSSGLQIIDISDR